MKGSVFIIPYMATNMWLFVCLWIYNFDIFTFKKRTTTGSFSSGYLQFCEICCVFTLKASDKEERKCRQKRESEAKPEETGPQNII